MLLEQLTPLEQRFIKAATTGHLEEVKAAIDEGVDINVSYEKWWEGDVVISTALYMAFEKKHYDVAELLLKREDLKVDLSRGHNMVPIPSDVISPLESYNMTELLFKAYHEKRVEIFVPRLVSTLKDMLAWRSDTMPQEIITLQRQIIDLFYSYCPQVLNEKMSGGVVFTKSLNYAVEIGAPLPIIKKLIECKADINGLDGYYNTPLHGTLSLRYFYPYVREVAEFLLERGATVKDHPKHTLKYLPEGSGSTMLERAEDWSSKMKNESLFVLCKEHVEHDPRVWLEAELSGCDGW